MCSKLEEFWHVKIFDFHGAQNSERNFGIRWSKTNDYTKSEIWLHVKKAELFKYYS